MRRARKSSQRMILLAHYRDVQVLEAVDDFHYALVDKNFCPRQKFIYQREQLDALADLRDLAIDGLASAERVINLAQNFFQGSVGVAEASIVRVARVQSAENQNINLHVGQERRAHQLRREGRIVARVQNIFPAEIYQSHHRAGDVSRLMKTYPQLRQREPLQEGDGRNIFFYRRESFFQLRG